MLPVTTTAAANMETTRQKAGLFQLSGAAVPPGHKRAGQGRKKGLEWESCPERFPWV